MRPRPAIVGVEVAEDDLAAFAAALEFDHFEDVRDSRQVRNPGHAETGGHDAPVRCGSQVPIAVVVAQVAGIEGLGVHSSNAEVELAERERGVTELGKHPPIVVLRKQHRLTHAGSPSCRWSPRYSER